MSSEPRSSSLSPGLHRHEEDYEKMLRPKSLDEFIGQQKIKDNLRVFVTAALQRGETLDHVLLSGPPGLGKCITADSLVLTGEGWMRFRDLIPGDMEPGTAQPLKILVYGVDGPEYTSHVYASGRVPTLRVTTRSGFVLEGTPHHPVLVATLEGPRWKSLESLSDTDYVALAINVEMWGASKPARLVVEGRARQYASGGRGLTPWRRGRDVAVEAGTPLRNRVHPFVNAYDRTDAEAAVRMGRSVVQGSGRRIRLDADGAYLLGFVVANGRLQGRDSRPWMFAACEEAAMQREITRVARGLFGEMIRPQRRGSGPTGFRFGPHHLKTLASFGLAMPPSPLLGMPSSVLTGSREIVVGFLQGLFDAGGRTTAEGDVTWCTHVEQLGREVQILLAQLGVIAVRRERQVDGRRYWELTLDAEHAVRFHERVGSRRPSRHTYRRRPGPSGAQSARDPIPGSAMLLEALWEKAGRDTDLDRDDGGSTPWTGGVLSRDQVERCLAMLPDWIAQEPEYAALQALMRPTIRWDRVDRVEASEAETYDFVVPGTHSFVANGFFNHNTTLAYIVAEEMGAGITTTSGPVLDKPASIAGILTNLNEGDVLFIDEIHRLTPVVEEYLYSAMEDYRIDIVIDSGPNARSVKLTLPPFTLIGATTRKGLLTAPLRARFGIDFRYDYYTADLLQRIVMRSARILGVEIDEEGAFEIARRSRGTPRIANRLLRRTRDFAEVEGDGRITQAMADRALNALDVDEEGLDDMDARILLTLVEKFGGGPTGLSNLAVSVGEDAGTIEEVYEPYLIQEGYIERTPRGRVATPRTYAHFGLEPPARTGDLFGR